MNWKYLLVLLVVAGALVLGGCCCCGGIPSDPDYYDAITGFDKPATETPVAPATATGVSSN